MVASLSDIDAALPQTQCTQCGYPRCLDYAAAIVNEQADINQCPPGGDITINKLAALTKQPSKALNPQFGEHLPKRIALIDEPRCIGCMLCIKACPVDAIIGANKVMHSIIPEQCTGCDLCQPVCPTDCIDMVPWSATAQASASADSPWPGYSQQQVSTARTQCEAKIARQAQKQAAKAAAKQARDVAQRQRVIADVLARKAQAKKT